MTKRVDIIGFTRRMIFQLMNGKNIDSQSSSCFIKLARLKSQTKLQRTFINRMLLCFGIDSILQLSL